MSDGPLKPFWIRWRTALGMILVYTFGYPPTFLVVIPPLLFHNSQNITNEDAGEAKNDLKTVSVSLFQVTSNIFPIVLSVIPWLTKIRTIAFLGTFLQFTGLIFLVTLSRSWCFEVIGFALAGSGIGVLLVNNIIITKIIYPDKITTIFGISLTFISVIGAIVPKLNIFIRQNTQATDEDLILLFCLLGLVVGLLGCLCLDKQTSKGDSKTQVWPEMRKLLSDYRYWLIASCNSFIFVSLVFLLPLLDEIQKIGTSEEKITLPTIQTIFISVQSCSHFPISCLADIKLNNNRDGILWSCFKRFMKSPRKNIYNLFTLILIFNVLLINLVANNVTMLIYTIVIAISSSAMFLMTNLVYFDYFQEKFNEAVTIGTALRGVFSILLMLPLSKCDMDVTMKLYILSGLMLLCTTIWKLFDCFNTKGTPNAMQEIS